MKNYTVNRKMIGIVACLLLIVFTLSACGTNEKSAASDYRDILLSFDYGEETSYVIGHKSPDSDTVGCAIA